MPPMSTRGPARQFPLRLDGGEACRSLNIALRCEAKCGRRDEAFEQAMPWSSAVRGRGRADNYKYPPDAPCVSTVCALACSRATAR